MDCAEGSYGQIYDHFQRKELVDEAIAKLRVVYITHLHGDHQLGVVKILIERDRLLVKEDPSNKLYLIAPIPLLDWLTSFKQQFLRFPDMVEIIPSNILNPEKEQFYKNDMVESEDRHMELMKMKENNKVFWNKNQEEAKGVNISASPVRTPEEI
mmetsp:Transcript_29504/g.21956  ORF Transcript_29504/g.21956 Transcript_29504/m.21956 type:complete len:155 (+) Transcript_29504:78-542(+)